MSKRMPLAQNTVLTLRGNQYRILKVLSENGASCLVYKAQLLACDNMFAAMFVIKEFYPQSFAKNITRDRNTGRIKADFKYSTAAAQYKVEQKKFISGAIKQIAFFYEDKFNHSFGTTQIDEANNTFYTITDFAGDFSLSNIDRSNLTLCEIAQIMISLCNAIKCIHSSGKLHLDIKPSNIFLFQKQDKESRRIALFDFDTVTDSRQLPTSGFFSTDWSPPEQQLWESGEISEATDVYAIGAVFYWLLTGEKVPEELSTQLLMNDFSFLNLYRALSGAMETASQILY